MPNLCIGARIASVFCSTPGGGILAVCVVLMIDERDEFEPVFLLELKTPSNDFLVSSTLDSLAADISQTAKR